VEDRNKGSRLGYNSPDVVTPMHPQVNATAYGRLLERLKSQADTGRLAVGYISNGGLNRSLERIFWTAGNLRKVDIRTIRAMGASRYAAKRPNERISPRALLYLMPRIFFVLYRPSFSTSPFFIKAISTGEDELLDRGCGIGQNLREVEGRRFLRYPRMIR